MAGLTAVFAARCPGTVGAALRASRDAALAGFVGRAGAACVGFAAPARADCPRAGLDALYATPFVFATHSTLPLRYAARL